MILVAAPTNDSLIPLCVCSEYNSAVCSVQCGETRYGCCNKVDHEHFILGTAVQFVALSVVKSDVSAGIKLTIKHLALGMHTWSTAVQFVVFSVVKPGVCVWQGCSSADQQPPAAAAVRLGSHLRGGGGHHQPPTAQRGGLLRSPSLEPRPPAPP